MSKQCFIYETLNGVKELQVQKNNNGLMTLSGVFGVCGVRNNNKRVYETSNYSKMVDEMKSRIKAEGGIPGELEHPANMNITLENISHKITSIDIDENGVVTGTISLLNTPKGKIAQAIVEGGLPLFISSRATGNVDARTGNVTLEKISTYDLVGSPGFSQAKLKLTENQIAECINESNIYYITDKQNIINNDENINENENINNMDEKILEKLESLEDRIDDLVEENNQLKEKINSYKNIDLEKLADGIQYWLVEQFSPGIQKWLEHEYIPNIKEELIDKNEIKSLIKEHILNDFAPKLEKWLINDYSSVIESWTINEFAKGIQKWFINEASPEIDKWVHETIIPTLENNMSDKIDEALEENRNNKLDSINKTLAMLESIDVKKPQYPSRNINESIKNSEEPLFIQKMPDAIRAKWELCSQDIKESIYRRAKLYNFINESSINRFWENINFDDIKPITKAYENLNNIIDENERIIRAKLRSFREKRNF